jgi:alcohol dehydrogenase class IV
MTELIFGEGAIAELGNARRDYPGPVAVITGNRSLERGDLLHDVSSALQERSWQRVTVDQRLPGHDSASACIEALDDFEPGVVVAIGGGTVIDTAKLVCLGLANGDANRLFGGGLLRPALPLVAVPTTAGSGAERTPFAVAYLNSVKHSIEHESLAPRSAIVDPVLTYSMPRELTVTTGLDAFTHSVESLWSSKADEASRELSRKSLYLAWNTISTVATEPSPVSRSWMAEAATTAGAAIATARTTAAHALSYHLTWHFAVPHGAAVALFLAPLIEFNGRVEAGTAAHVGGAEAVVALVSEVAGLMGAPDAIGARAALKTKLGELGAPTNLSDVGLESDDQVEALIDSVNLDRLANNPRRLGEEDLRQLVEEVR